MEMVEPTFSKAIIQSLFYHILIILLLVSKTVLFPNEKIDFQHAIRVDVVDLPDKLEPTLESKRTPPEKVEQSPAVQKPSESVKESTPPMAETMPKPVVKEAIAKPKRQSESIVREKAKEQALARIKALQRIEEDLKKQNLQKNESAKKQEYKGNILSSGTELTGIQKIQHDNYISDLDRHVKGHWVLPQWMGSANLRATVRVYLDDKGYVVRKEMVQSSGNKIYDQMVVNTIEKASPFPAPPEKFIDIVGVKGVEFGFPE